MVWTDPRTWTDGELVTASIMNTHVRDNLNAVGPIVKIRKPTTESVTSSAVVQDDNDFTFAVAASEVWEWRLIAVVTSGATGGFRRTFTAPSGATGGWNDRPDAAYPQTTPALQAFATERSNAATLTSGTFEFTGVVVNSTTAGNLLFRWGQATSDGTATSVLANSFLIAHRIA